MIYHMALPGIAFAFAASGISTPVTNAETRISATPTVTLAPRLSESLKGKSDEELLRLVVGGRNDDQKKYRDEAEQDRARFSSLDRLWEMPPRDAAVALASDYVAKEVKGQIRFKIDDSGNPKPPTSGEIGLRWILGNEYVTPEHGVIILRYDGTRSKFLVSAVEILGPVSKQELEGAVMKTDEFPLSAAVAQQIYEILWWLRRVRLVGEKSGHGSVYSTADDFGNFWMKTGWARVE